MDFVKDALGQGSNEGQKQDDQTQGQERGSNGGFLGSQERGSSGGFLGGQEGGSSGGFLGGQEGGNSGGFVGGQEGGNSGGFLGGQGGGNSGGFLGSITDKINSVAGGGRESEKNEDMLDKGIDLVQEKILGQGPQDNESAAEQAKDEQISDFIRDKYKSTTGSDFPIEDKETKLG